MPVEVPGEAASPGRSNCSLANAPTFTAMAGLVFAALLPSARSVAVTVALPPVLSVRLKALVPEAKVALAGNVALPSLEVMPTVSVAVPTTFQLASTPLTVTVKAAPAVRGVGVPDLPPAVPGAAVSPGTSN